MRYEHSIKMGSKPYNNFDYDAYYDWKESTNESAYFHDGNKKDEYVYYEHNNGEYIFESGYNLASSYFRLSIHGIFITRKLANIIHFNALCLTNRHFKPSQNH